MANNKSTTTQQSKATSMADLMAKHTTTLVTFHKGDIIPGTISKLTSGEILVDIGAKTEAVVLEKDRNILRTLLESLKVGDRVDVSILNPESDLGNPVVSLRRFIDEKVWEDLEDKQKEKTVLDVKVDEATKGGFLITSTGGISGFLPNSQVAFTQNSEGLVGQTIKSTILELNRALHKVIFSQKATVGAGDFDDAIAGLKRGDKLSVSVSNVAPFGIFVLIKNGDKNAEGFIHVSEISWKKVDEPLSDLYKPGDVLEAEITGFDNEGKRVNLSIKRLTIDPFEAKVKNYKPEQKVEGVIKKISSIGIIVDLGDDVEGIIKKEKVPPNVKYTAGSKIEATISEIDSQRHRIVITPVLLEKPIGYR